MVPEEVPAQKVFSKEVTHFEKEGEIDYRTTYCSKYELSYVHEINNMNMWSVHTRIPHLIGDTIYFVGSDNFNGSELWGYDTVTGSVWLVGEIDIGYNSWNTGPHILAVDKDIIYMMGSDGNNGWELWMYNTYTRSISMVEDINIGSGNSYPGSSGMEMIVGDRFYFAADDGVSGRELWV